MQEPSQIEHLTVHQEKNGDKFNKYIFLFIKIFSVIIIIIILIYFISSSVLKTRNNSEKSTPQSIDSIDKVSFGLNQTKKDINFSELDRFLKTVQRFSEKSQFIEDIKYSYTVSGKIQSIETTESTSDSTKTLKKITLASSDGEQIYYYLPQENLHSTSVFLITPMSADRIDFSEVKVNDIVTIEFKGDLLNNNQQAFIIRVIRE